MTTEEKLDQAHAILYAYGEDNEFTQDPWWCVVAKNRMGPSAILAGPFFSREAAERHRMARIYEYGVGSIVYCFSGYYGSPYRKLREMLR